MRGGSAGLWRRGELASSYHECEDTRLAIADDGVGPADAGRRRPALEDADAARRVWQTDVHAACKKYRMLVACIVACMLGAAR